MKSGKRRQNRFGISVLTVMMMIAGFLPLSAVYAEDGTEEPQTEIRVPDNGASEEKTEPVSDPSEDPEDPAEPADGEPEDPAIAEDSEPIEPADPAVSADPEPAKANAPALRGDRDALPEVMEMDVTINWEGDEPEDRSSRPLVIYLTAERSTDGENWYPYVDDVPFAITSFYQDPHQDPDIWTDSFNFPVADEEGNLYTYRVTESIEGLGRYLMPQNVAEFSYDPDKPIEVAFTNTYNDEWDYHLRLFWDVSTDEGKVLQDVHTTDKSTQELTYHVAVSTQKSYEACDDPLNPTSGLTVRIPRALCTDRDSSPIYPSAISVGTGEDYDPYYFFKYAIDPETDELVFYNWKELPGSYNIDIKVQYRLDPRMFRDCTLTELNAMGEGHYPYQPATDDGVQYSDPIYYRLDTGAEFTKFTKDDGYPLRAVPPALSGYTFDFSNYHYMVYILRYQIDGNQPVKPLTFTDKPRTEEGEKGKVFAILQPDETDTVYGSGADEVHTYTRPAAALSTPSGTPVSFTEEGGVAAWTQEYDLLRKSENGNYAVQGEQCYYLIVQYAGRDENGYIIEEKLYHNDDATGSLEVSDDQHPTDVRGDNDLYDTDDEKDDATGLWEPEHIPPVGPGPYYADKRTGENAYPAYFAGYTRLKYGLFHIFSVTTNFNVDGEWLQDHGGYYYFADWYDDDLFMRGYYDDGTGEKWHEYIKLGARDYQIWYTLKGSVYFDVTAYDIDSETGEHLPQAGEFTVQVKNSSGQWVDYDTFTLDSTGHARYEPDPGGANGLAGRGYYGIRLKTPKGMTSHLSMNMNVWYVINGSSPVARDLLDYKGATDLHIINHATNDLYLSTSKDGTYTLGNPETPATMPKGEYPWVEATGIAKYAGEMDGVPEGYVRAYRSAGNTPRKYTQNCYIVKSLLEDDTEDHQETHSFSHHWAIAPCEYMNTSAIPRDVLNEMGFSADSGTVYDLLPPGYHLDTTKPIEVSGTSGAGAVIINPTMPASLVDYTVTPNFKGTGQDLVTFHIKSDRDQYDNIFISGYSYTGFTVRFWTKVSYFDVEEDEVRNVCMYQRGDKRAIDGTVAYSDMRGYGVDPAKYPKGSDGEYVMRDLDGDGIEQDKSAMYYSTPVHPTAIETLQDGLYKFVKGNGGLWVTSDKTDPSGLYSYQIIMESADEGKTSNVVLYDVMEDAANTGGATDEDEGWKGVLLDVDVSQAVDKGISPVVYYTTENVSYNDGQSAGSTDWVHSLVKDPDIWSVTMPEDPSKITAVAIDLRWKDAAHTEPFIFDGADSVGVILNMRAPAKVPPTPYAYNRPAFTSTIQPNSSPNPSTSFNISTRTKIELRSFQDFEFFKYYETTDAEGQIVKQGLGGATFELYQCTSTDPEHEHHGMPGSADSCWGTEPKQTKVSPADGTVKFETLATGDYAVIESAVPSKPNGLQLLENRWWIFSVDADEGTVSKPQAYSTDPQEYPVVEMEWDESSGEGRYTLKNEVPVFNISVEKLWEGRVPFEKTLTFNLYIGNETAVYKTRTVTVPVIESTLWIIKDLFTELPRFDVNGKPITYRLEEESCAGYAVTEPTDGSVVFPAPEVGDYSTRFTNTEMYEPARVHFEGLKTLSGKELQDAEFRFTLTGSDGTKETVTNDGRGRIVFRDIIYDEAGTYTYEVKEEATGEDDIIFDSTVYKITVTVTDDGEGHLTAKVTGADISALNFTNTYIDIKVLKVDDRDNAVIGAVLAVKDSSGRIIDQWTTDGSVHEVEGLKPDQTYVLTEVKAPAGYERTGDITFSTGSDGRVKVLRMVDKKIIIPIPDTSDSVHTGMWAAATGMSCLLAALAFAMLRRYS